MASKLLYSLAVVVFVSLIGRLESTDSNKICLPPFKKIKKKGQMSCMLDKKLLPNEAFLKHMCGTYGGEVQDGSCLSYEVDRKATATRCPHEYTEYYFEHMKYCMKAVREKITGELNVNAPKLCGEITDEILFPWNKAVNMFAFALTGKDCTTNNTGNYYIWFDYVHKKDITNIRVGKFLLKSFEVKSFKERVEKDKLETKWLDGSRVFMKDDNPTGSAVVLGKCGMWKVVPQEDVGGVICLAAAD